LLVAAQMPVIAHERPVKIDRLRHAFGGPARERIIRDLGSLGGGRFRHTVTAGQRTPDRPGACAQLDADLSLGESLVSETPSPVSVNVSRGAPEGFTPPPCLFEPCARPFLN